ncbi:hypothetical protein [Lactiplantibacillus plajomi]|jgi:hypothetical protein|uniref:Uncharacterized protein n=1 Tax=Lactiplantibacillus plajomi TaxID=1457217 RepID=A0ABV6K5N6_9LACO|nr:hypothetical protein [Lactiplantibacillus plajomi]
MKTSIEALYDNLADDLQRRDPITGTYEFDAGEFESKRDYYAGRYDALASLVDDRYTQYLADLEAHAVSLAPIRDWLERGQYEPA